MPRNWASVLLFLVVPCLAAPTCGGGIGDKLEGEPCTRDDECGLGLECIGGVCDTQEEDAGEEDAGEDAGADGGLSDGAVTDAR